MTPPDHLRRALEGFLTGRQFHIAADPATTDHYRERTAVLVALSALNIGASPYVVLTLSVVSAFLDARETPAEVVKVEARPPIKGNEAAKASFNALLARRRACQ